MYQHGTPAAQVAIKVSLAGSLLIAIVSVFFLLEAVRPYEPKALASRLRKRDDYNEVFFPDIRKLKREAKGSSCDKFEQLVSKVEANVKALGESDAVDREYVAELLKVADIRAHEADRAQAGFLLLGLEVLFVAMYLATVGCIAGHMLGAASTTIKPSLRWDVVQSAHRLPVASRSSLTVSPPAEAQVQFLVSDEFGLQRVYLVTRTTYRCVKHGATRYILASEPSTQDVRLPHAKSFMLTTSFGTRPRRCPRRLRYAGIAMRFSAVAHSDSGARTSGWLILRAHA